MKPRADPADEYRGHAMRQTVLILTLIFVVVLAAHYRMVTRANTARAELMLEPLPSMPSADSDAAREAATDAAADAAGHVADLRSP